MIVSYTLCFTLLLTVNVVYPGLMSNLFFFVFNVKIILNNNNDDDDEKALFKLKRYAYT